MAIAGLTNLCLPSKIYMALSFLLLAVMVFQNMSGNKDIFCLGEYSCNTSSKVLIFVIQVVYILFWTWVLNLICRAGASTLSWILVLLPILFYVTVTLMFMYLYSQ
jgi:hypothetical protein